ncbi:MAG TPA: hypothetical protein VGK67_39680, partial [Myxococcales bacterium]
GCTIACLPGWADCDPLIPGCETNTNLSNDHCGKCARKCAPANADAFACEEGLCVVKTCTSGYTDCDTNPWNGCEIHTSADPTHCGTCSTQCTVNHGLAACNNGQCAIGSCTSPWLNCDGAYATGCNINKETDTDNCGACNSPCKPATNQTAVCGTSGCTRNCVTDFLDCDNNSGTGCEVSINNLPLPPPANNCGSFIELGDIAGDANSVPLVKQGVGEIVYHVGFLETRFGSSNEVTSGQIKLESPTGVSYSMFLSLGGTCGGSTQMVDASGGVATKNLCTSDGDYGIIFPDYVDAWIEIVRRDGQGCGQWKLTITGNIAAAAATCP